jgi:hypothetical protein
LNWIRDTPRERLERVYRELSKLGERGAIGAVVEATYPLDQFQGGAAAHTEERARGQAPVHPESGTRGSIEVATVSPSARYDTQSRVDGMFSLFFRRGSSH